MLRQLLLTAAVLAAPAPAVAAPPAAEKVIPYFAQVCADGLEHFGVYTSTDDTIHDLTKSAGPTTVEWDDERLVPLCQQESLAVYHCHPTNDALSRFPGVTPDNTSDFSTAAHLEYLCATAAAEHGLPAPRIEHRLIHTGGSNAVVRYGLTTPLARIRELAAEQGAMTQELRDLSAIGRTLEGQRRRNDEMAALYGLLTAEYFGEVVMFLRESCPKVQTPQDLAACEEFSLERFIATRPRDRPYFIEIESDPQPALPVITLQQPNTYPAWATELTPRNYEQFLKRERALLLKCGTDNPFHPTCDAAVQLGREARQYCYGLDVGILNTDIFDVPADNGLPELRSELLFSRGQETVLTAPIVTPYLFGLIFCGMNVDGNGRLLFPRDDPQTAMETAYDALRRVQDVARRQID